MSRNGSGAYSLPSGNPVVTGTTISSTVHNATLADIATEMTNSLAKDGQTTPTANLPMGNYKHTGVANATVRTDYCSAGQSQDNIFDWLTSVSGADTITAGAAISLAAYAAGQTFRFVAAGTNTTAVTLNINSIGAKAITKNGTTPLVAGDIASGSVVIVVYDGTRFQLSSGLKAEDIGVSVQAYDANLASLSGLALAQGDILVATGVDTVARLAKGTASQHLRINAGATAPEWFTPPSSGITLGTPVASTSGVSIDFTGIPATAKRITVMLSGVSTNGTSNMLLQIGDSGGVEDTGYVAGTAYLGGANTASTAGFLISHIVSAATTISGQLVLNLQDSATNTWVAAGIVNRSDGVPIMNAGVKSLSAALDRVRPTMANGSDAFDAGSISISYE